jgi:hypothetical protein
VSLTPADVRKIALSFPGVTATQSHGNPSFHVGKRFFTWIRPELHSLVTHVDSVDERDALIASDPATFHITDHYRGLAMVLVRLEKADKALVRHFLERRFRAVAPKKILKDYDAGKKG